MKLLRLYRVLMFALALVVAFAPLQTLSALLNQTLPGCKSTCGDVEIPYPFGIGDSSTFPQQPCYLEPIFNLTCDDSSLLKWGSVTILKINVPAHQIDILFRVSRFCNSAGDNNPWLKTGKSCSVSSKENKFITVGCDSYGYLDSVYHSKRYTTGCLTRCYGNELEIDDGTCSGIGCCQVDIPPRMTNISIKASSYSVDTGRNASNGMIPNPNQARVITHTRHVLSTVSEPRFLPANRAPRPVPKTATVLNSTCTYSFVVKHDTYKFNISHLNSFPNKTFPLVLDWIVGNKSCSAFESRRGDYACSNNSYCDDKDTDHGYRCICNNGYEGNAYLNETVAKMPRMRKKFVTMPRVVNKLWKCHAVKFAVQVGEIGGCQLILQMPRGDQALATYLVTQSSELGADQFGQHTWQAATGGINCYGRQRIMSL